METLQIITNYGTPVIQLFIMLFGLAQWDKMSFVFRCYLVWLMHLPLLDVIASLALPNNHHVMNLSMLFRFAGIILLLRLLMPSGRFRKWYPIGYLLFLLIFIIDISFRGIYSYSVVSYFFYCAWTVIGTIYTLFHLMKSEDNYLIQHWFICFNLMLFFTLNVPSFTMVYYIIDHPESILKTFYSILLRVNHWLHWLMVLASVIAVARSRMNPLPLNINALNTR